MVNRTAMLFNLKANDTFDSVYAIYFVIVKNNWIIVRGMNRLIKRSDILPKKFLNFS